MALFFSSSAVVNLCQHVVKQLPLTSCSGQQSEGLSFSLAAGHTKLEAPETMPVVDNVLLSLSRVNYLLCFGCLLCMVFLLCVSRLFVCAPAGLKRNKICGEGFDKLEILLVVEASPDSVGKVPHYRESKLHSGTV